MNVISAETAEKNADREGQYTFNSYPPDDYDGPLFVFAALGLGDHAHVEVSSGRAHPDPSRLGYGPGGLQYGRAGSFIMKWNDWVILRDVLVDAYDGMRIAEVRRASTAQLTTHFNYHKPVIAQGEAG